MAEPDLFRRLLAPPHAWLIASATPWALSPALSSAITQLLNAGVLALFGSALILVAAEVERLVETSDRSSAATRRSWLLLMVTGAIGLGTLLWILHSPSPSFIEVFFRLDHLALCACTGVVLAQLGPAARGWMTAALSVTMLTSYTGLLPIVVGVTVGVIGFLATRFPALQTARRAALAHGTIGALAYGFCWWLRASDPMSALRVQGLLVFWYLRHLSYVIDHRRAGAIGLGGYLCYLCFYPGSHGLVGGPEVYHEFSRRNLGTAVRLEHRLAMRRLLAGTFQSWLALRLPQPDLFAERGTLALWGVALILFVRSALAVMAAWALVDASALLYGVRLRRNFAGILTCQNPGELWRSWRGTMTYWLISHVYAPLGGNRRHQALNIAAAFGVSLLWHWSGVPFLTGDFRAAHLAPIMLWAAANATAVIVYVSLQGHRFHVLPAGTPQPIRRGSKILLTACLGALGVILPAMQSDAIGQLLPFLRRLLALG